MYAFMQIGGFFSQTLLWFAVCWAHQGLSVGFLLLGYSVLFTVESLSLLYRLVISSFKCLGDNALIS